MRNREKVAELDADLKAMFRASQARALPDRLRCVVDQIYADAPPPMKKSA